MALILVRVSEKYEQKIIYSEPTGMSVVIHVNNFSWLLNEEESP